MARTHYQVLGVDREASSVDIAAAFRERIEELKAKAGASPESVAAVRTAYQVLGTPELRREYDASIAPPVRAAPARRPAPTEASGDDEAKRPWLTFAIPAALVVVAVVGWRMSGKPDPAPVIEDRTATFTQPAPREASQRGAAPQVREVAAAEPAGGTPVAGSPLSASDLFATASPSVVRVLATDGGGQALQQGSGVVVEHGQVITNCHVTRGSARLEVRSGGASLPASVELADEHLDLCLLRVRGLEAPAATLSGASGLRTGQRVYAIGSPMGLELTLSEGLVSALRTVDEGTVIQTTAPVSPGSSGGGLFDTEARLVGIVTFQHRFGQNLNFALPAEWIAQMRDRRLPAAPIVEREPASDAERVLGAWYCFGTFTGRNGEYDFGTDGTVAIKTSDGKAYRAGYRLAERKLQYFGGGEALTVTIEVLTGDRMVQLLSEGRRIACDRR
jgi:serine protease Do